MNAEEHVNGSIDVTDQPEHDHVGFSIFNRSTPMFLNPENPTRFEKIDLDGPDKTSHDEIESLLITTLIECKWFDPNGQPGFRPSVAEVVAVVRAVIRGIADRALTKEAFLINLAALAGGHFMIRPDKEVHRLEIGPDFTKYLCKWKMHYGAIRGVFTLTETVPHSKWKPGHQQNMDPHQQHLVKDAMPSEGIPAAEYWQQQYASLAATSIRRLNSMTAAKANALRFLNENPDVDSHRPV